MSRYKLIDEKESLIEGGDWSCLSCMSQLSPGWVRVSFGVDEIENVLNHFSLMNRRVHVLESRWLALWFIDCKIGIEPYFDFVLSSDADHSVPHTQNSIEPKQILKTQQT